MANNRDYTSIHNVKDFILNQIAPRYFDIDDISLLNTGLFGMITDISGTAIEDSFNATSRYITELIPGKSKLSEFIYAYAANYGVTNIFSTCSRCSAVIFIKESDVLSNAEINGNTRTYVIDSDLVVYVEDVPFSIPYDIKIISTYYDGKFNHRCYYDKNMINSAIDGQTIPYIKCGKTTVNGESEPYLAITVTLFQYKRNRTTEQIVSNNKLNIAYIDVSYENTLCNFEVLYSETEYGNKVQLTKLLERAVPTLSPFTFYKAIDDQTIRLSFANDDSYFIPEYNSTIDILTYECMGSKGNMPKYDGNDMYVTGSSENPNYSYNNDIAMFCVMLSDAEGGSDALTIQQISDLTAEKRLTVNSITTDNDLDNFFGTYAPLYNTYAKFIKFRDDLVTREYSCYTRLRDDEEVFPTNTVDVDVKLSRLPYSTSVNANRIIIKAGTRISYCGDSNDQCEVIDAGSDPMEIEYTTLGLTSITKSPTIVGSYMNSVNKTIPVDYDYINDYSKHQFLLNSMTIVRDATLGDDTYTITVTIIPSDMTIMSNTIDDDDNYADYVPDVDDDLDDADDYGTIIEDEVDDNGLIIKNIGVYIHVATESGHYIKLDYDADSSSDKNGYVFTCDIGTSDITNDVNIELLGMTDCSSQNKENCYTAMQNPPITIIIGYDEDNGTVERDHEYSKLIPALSHSVLCNTFVPMDGYLYFAYPLSLIKSTVEFKQDTTESIGYSLRLLDLPVVGKDFVSDVDNLTAMLDRLNSQHKFLSSVQLESNYSINMKFFNTYGRSRVFTTTTGELLNRVNCDLDLSIKFKEGVVPDDYLQSIKITIKEYIENCNESSSSSTGVNDVRISALISLLHSTYQNQISYIVINSLNGYGPEVQTIIMGVDLTLSENMYTIPEFLTLDVDNIAITVL